MIVRTTNVRARDIDYGPTPGLSHLALSGSIARPAATRPRLYPSNTADYKRDWRAKRRVAVEARPKVCRNGLHEVRAGNALINPKGGVLCRACAVASQRRRDQRRHARAAA